MKLKDFFEQNPRTALGFSGGTDSSYLLYAALKYGRQVGAYYVKTPFQPQFELEDAKRLSGQLGAGLTVLEHDILSYRDIAANPQNRCYYCKRAIFGLIARHAAADGFTILIDGTNASDDEGDRPGMLALRELSVRSPLRECGITKDELRRLSREAGLFTWEKPAYACLATRIPAGEEITAQKLELVEKSERLLFEMGFSDLRVRLRGRTARLELPASQHAAAIDRWGDILAALGNFDRVELTERP